MQLRVKRVVGLVVVSVACITVIFCYLRSTKSSSALSGDATLLLQTVTIALNTTNTRSDVDDLGGSISGELRFILHQGMDSADGNIELNNTIGELFDIDELMMECMRMAGRCVGFTTDGSLKHFIQPYNNWTMNKEGEGGLYTLDTNYCELSEGHHCKVGKCLNAFNGTYSCLSNSTNNSIISNEKNNKTNLDANVMTNNQQQETNEQLIDYSSYIHIVVSVDVIILDGLVAMVQSVIEHTGNNDVIIHIVVNSTNRQTIENRITCSLSIPHNVEIMYKVFNLPKEFVNLIKINGQVKYLSSSANFARLFFGQIFPELSHVLYLDVDILVQHDISELWKSIIGNNHLLTVVPRGNKPCSKYFFKSMPALYRKRYHKRLQKLKCSGFNAGVVGFNLDKWRKKKIFDEVKYWMGENLKQELWELGTQPVMYAVSIGDLELVDKRWNYGNLGIYGVPQSRVKKAYIVHWNGRDKPWGVRMSLGSTKDRKKYTRQYDKLWKSFYREVCSGKGACVQDVTSLPAVCVCNKNYKGKYCEKH